jgi:hypothetical protein
MPLIQLARLSGGLFLGTTEVLKVG